MKLRNKKTGQIYNACHIAFGESIEGLERKRWKTLEEFNEDWEDVPEEKKGVWFIDCDGNVVESELVAGKIISLEKQAIGNYFETKEEAEKAVERLRAWKRLKDNGARFKEWFWDEHYGTCIILGDSEEHDYVDDTDEQIRKDLDLLFSGEDD